LWRVELSGAEGLTANAFVLAPDAELATEVAVADPAPELGSLRGVAIHELGPTSEILDLHMDVGDVELDPAQSTDGPTLWKLHWNDGLFHRSPGASLVAEGDAVSALRLVIDEDPFEGQPPYGVPPAYGPVVRFAPTNPIVLWTELDWVDDDAA
jgi:hypothetical protein